MHGLSSTPDTFLDVTIEPLNIKYMLILGHIIQGYTKISHLCPQWFKFTISMYAGNFETTLQVQFIDLLYPTLNVIHFQVFNHTLCRKQNVLVCNIVPLVCIISQHKVVFSYLSKMTFGGFGTMIGSTCWNLWRNFFLSNMAHWVHICPQPF